MNLYANPSRGMGHAPRNRMPIIIGAAVVIIILIVVVNVIQAGGDFASRKKNKK